MRIEDRDAAGPTSASSRGPKSQAGQLIQRLRDRQAGAWRVAACIGLALLGGSTMLAWLSRGTETITLLENGRNYSVEEAESIRSALTRIDISATIDEKQRIAVPTDSLSEALKVLDDLNLARRSLREDLENIQGPSLWSDPVTNTERILRNWARPIETMIERNIAGVRSALVFPSSDNKTFSKPVVRKVSVLLETDQGESIDPGDIGRILNFVVLKFPDLDRDRDIIIVDGRGDAVWQPNDPGAARLAKAKAQAKVWESKILEMLRWEIEGVHVSVSVSTLPPSVRQEPSADGTIAAVVPNGALTLDAAESGDPSGTEPRVNILVDIPAQYYLKRYGADTAAGLDTQVDLEPLVAFAEARVERAVDHIIPNWGETRGNLTIGMLALPAEEQATRSTSKTLRPWWAPAAIVAAVASIALLLAASARRPTSPKSKTGTWSGPHRPHLRDDDRPSPADQVRELVRSDPDAAAAVLRRWVEEGGHA